MAYANVTRHASAPTGLGAWIASFLSSALFGAVKLYQVRRAREELRSLDDRMLADIGLTRGQIR